MTLRLLVAACACTLPAAHISRADEPTRVAYTLQKTPGDGVRVSVTTIGEADGTSRFEIAPDWGGIEHCERFVGTLSASDEHGGPLVTSVVPDTPTAWEVSHAPGATITLSYDIKTSAKDALESFETHYEPVVRADLVHLIGDTCLVFPAWLEHEKVETSLTWSGFNKAGWLTTSSFDAPGSSAGVSGELFRHAIFLAAPLDKVMVADRKVPGGLVRLCITGTDWAFAVDELADLVAKIVEVEREFAQDYTDPYFLVTVVPTGPRADVHSISMGGTGLTDAFALFLAPGTAIGDGTPHRDRVLQLLAHEYFHTWNGGKIRTDEREELVYWFSEGFTDYYAARLLRRAGLTDDARWLARTNETISSLWRSPVATEPATTIERDFWTRREVQQLPYQRGECVAIVLDAAIRRSSGNTKNIDDFMRELLRDAGTGLRVTTDELIARIARWTTPATAEVIRATVVGGKLPDMPRALAEPACERQDRESYLYEEGFDADATVKTRVVTGVVPGSEAARAGLRDGQKMAGISIARGSPEREAMVRVEENGATRELKFYPRGSPRTVPAYTPTPKR